MCSSDPAGAGPAELGRGQAVAAGHIGLGAEVLQIEPDGWARLGGHAGNEAGGRVAAEAFDDRAGYTLASQIFIDEKPAYYDFANKTHNMTGAEVFAAFAPPA